MCNFKHLENGKTSLELTVSDIDYIKLFTGLKLNFRHLNEHKFKYNFNPFTPIVTFLYPLKTSCIYVSIEYRNVTLGTIGFRTRKIL